MKNRIVIDQMGNEVNFYYPPQRIVSLVPSQTELLFDLGLDDRVVGITKFCEHPQIWQQTKTKVGGTKKLRLIEIDQLRPDLIIGNKEENDRDSINELQRKYPVWLSDIVTFDDALAMITAVGEMVGKSEEAKAMVDTIEIKFQGLNKKSGTILYLIWRNPWMAAGTPTFINSIICLLGFTNVVKKQRYPITTIEEIIAMNPDYIFLSSEPFPFNKEHVDELKKHLPGTKITLVDGQYFSWYGSRLLRAPDYFNQLLTV